MSFRNIYYYIFKTFKPLYLPDKKAQFKKVTIYNTHKGYKKTPYKRMQHKGH